MGTADLMPGVSGGTVALILGVYEELIQSIVSINLKNLNGMTNEIVIQKLIRNGLRNYLKM